MRLLIAIGLGIGIGCGMGLMLDWLLDGYISYELGIKWWVFCSFLGLPIGFMIMSDDDPDEY
tara:strand:+ start:200 stop:385 length:186 start_codon:yes stop_codon:yes gene_type:complete